MFDTFDYTKRIFILNGYVTDDFINNKLSVINISNLLLLWLKEQQKYDSVIFINSSGGITFLDEKSAEIMIAKSLQKTKAKPSSGLMKRTTKLTNRPNTTSVNTTDIKFKYEDFAKNINEFRERIVKWMNNKENKVAIIFEDNKFLDKNRVGDDIYDLFRNDFINYKQLPVDNKNIIIFLFQFIENGTNNIAYNFAEKHLSEIFGINEEGKRTGFAVYKRIGLPNKDEIKLLINNIRLKNELKTDFSFLDNFVDNIAVLSKKKKLDLKTLHKEMLEIKSFDKQSLKAICKKYDFKEIEKTGQERLNELVGHKKVKRELYKIVNGSEKISNKEEYRGVLNYRFIKQKINSKLKNNLLHFALLGNPGTGKTTIAAIIGQLFRENGLLPIGHVIKATRDDLVGGYIGQTAIKTKELIERAIGGVLFVDEAYTLIKKGDFGNDFGKEALDTILEAMSDRAGEFTVILAGYKNEMNRVLEDNPGMKRRIINLDLEDFNEEELAEIFKQKVKNCGIDYDEEIINSAYNLAANILKNRKDYGGENFGNAGVIENIVNNAIRDAKSKNSPLSIKNFEDKEQAFFTKVVKKGDTTEEFDNLIGLTEVKEKIKKIKKIVEHKKNRKEKIELGHFLFRGNPGTGKTTVANYITNQFYELGAIKSNRFINKTASDFLGTINKSSQTITKEILDNSLNSVLFIDEAHQLADNPAGEAVLKTIVPFMEDNRDQFILIMGGYPEEIDNMLEKDPGLKSRFKNIINFPDYTGEDLAEILKKNIEKENYQLADNVSNKEIIKKMKELKASEGNHFGNARSVRNYFEKVVENYAVRVDTISEKYILEKSDLEIDEEDKDISLSDSLENIIGLENVKLKLKSMIAKVKMAQKRRKEVVPGHYIFSGNPGTGKTTIARLFAKEMYEIGIISTKEVKEISATDLIGQYIGETENKTKKLLNNSLGKVLFIDEAHQLYNENGKGYGSEAIKVLVPFSENNRNTISIILAGYPKEIERLLNMDPGLKSRFSENILFEDYDSNELLDIFKHIVKDDSFKLDSSIKDQDIISALEKIRQREGVNFGNGRSVRNYFEQVKGNLDCRVVESNDDSIDINTIIKEDLRDDQ